MGKGENAREWARLGACDGEPRLAQHDRQRGQAAEAVHALHVHLQALQSQRTRTLSTHVHDTGRLHLP